MAVRFVPAHVNETTEPVDNLGGILSAVLVGVGHPRHQLRAGPRARARSRSACSRSRRRPASRSSIASGAPPSPLYDLDIASRRIFWVAACAGIIVFGSLMGAMFIGQQYLQNVLGYSTLDAGAAIIPAALVMVMVAPRSARLVEARGARFTLLLGYVFCLAWLRHDVRCCGPRAARTGRSRSATRSSASASGSPARRPRIR